MDKFHCSLSDIQFWQQATPQKAVFLAHNKEKLLNFGLQTPPENDIANQFLIDNSKYGKDNTVINEAKEIYYQSILGEMVWPLNLM